MYQHQLNRSGDKTGSIPTRPSLFKVSNSESMNERLATYQHPQNLTGTQGQEGTQTTDFFMCVSGSEDEGESNETGVRGLAGGLRVD